MGGQFGSRPRFLLFAPPSVHRPPGKKSSGPGAVRAATRLALLVALLAAGCMDLDVTNPNEPDSERALATAGDVEALIKASYNSWFYANYGVANGSTGTPGFFLSSQAFQNSPPWANYGIWELAPIPRVAMITEVTWAQYWTTAFAWRECYGALSALASGLKALEDPTVARAVGDSLARRDRAYGKFVQGLAHGALALLYARGFVVDETVDVEEPQLPVGYQVLMEQALGYLDESIALASSHSFSFPFDWMQVNLDAPGLARLAHAYKARFRAQVARTREERAAVDWQAVIADVDAGIQATHILRMDWDVGWENLFLGYSTYYRWTQLPYFMFGMADQSGAVAAWYTLPPTQEEAAGGPAKSYLLPDGRPVLIVTPDLRFPQGATVAEQRGREGRYFRIAAPSEGLGGGNSTWVRPERGVWRWSWYKAGYGGGADYYFRGQFDQREMTLAELRLLKAEGLYRRGDRAGAAAIVNETRVASGLSPTDAAGTNASCVPRLPDGSCGDLWEMLKWEKRMETFLTGPFGSNWFFDGRGWGDLWKGTPLHLPIPCSELETLRMTPCTTFGGPGGVMGAPVSTYAFPFER